MEKHLEGLKEIKKAAVAREKEMNISRVHRATWNIVQDDSDDEVVDRSEWKTRHHDRRDVWEADSPDTLSADEYLPTPWRSLRRARAAKEAAEDADSHTTLSAEENVWVVEIIG